MKQAKYRIVPYRNWSDKTSSVVIVYELWERCEYGGWSGVRGIPMKSCESVDEVFLLAAAAGIGRDEIEISDEF